jgi:hypothetical protein
MPHIALLEPMLEHWLGVEYRSRAAPKPWLGVLPVSRFDALKSRPSMSGAAPCALGGHAVLLLPRRAAAKRGDGVRHLPGVRRGLQYRHNRSGESVIRIVPKCAW